jgi:hypothetical protein
MHGKTKTLARKKQRKRGVGGRYLQLDGKFVKYEIF